MLAGMLSILLAFCALGVGIARLIWDGARTQPALRVLVWIPYALAFAGWFLS
jgi:hypothetical protein